MTTDHAPRNPNRQHYNRDGEPKLGYPTKREAKASADLHSHGTPNVYRCPVCRLYHLGNSEDEWRAAPPNNRRPRRRLDRRSAGQ
jgi:hypothetical protein